MATFTSPLAMYVQVATFNKKGYFNVRLGFPHSRLGRSHIATPIFQSVFGLYIQNARPLSMCSNQVKL